MSVTSRVIAPIALALTGLALLTGCGSSDTTTSTPISTNTPTAAASTASTAPSAAPSSLPSDAAAQFAQVQQCLEAAGITVPTPSIPSGATPSGVFSPPAGGAGGLNDPQVAAALDACGISLPTGPPSGAAVPTPATS